jgi:hypothetical protein
MTRTWKWLALSVLALAVPVGNTVASIPAADGTYYGCYLKNVGALRLIDNAKHSCLPFEVAVSWKKDGGGAVGPAGSQGPAGASGLQGTAGPQGPIGPTGPSGRDDRFGTDTSRAARGQGGDCTLGAVTLTAGSIANGVPAAGQLLPISQHTALFALLGTLYGGNGQTTGQAPPRLPFPRDPPPRRRPRARNLFTAPESIRMAFNTRQWGNCHRSQSL